MHDDSSVVLERLSEGMLRTIEVQIWYTAVLLRLS